MLAPRSFNNISILDYATLRKSSNDSHKMIGEYRWHESQSILKHPAVYNLNINTDGASYDMQYIHGRTLADCFVNKILTSRDFRDIFTAIRYKISKMRQQEVKMKDFIGFSSDDFKITEFINKELYKDKTISRLKKYGINLNTEYTLNGKKMPSLNTIINDCNVNVTFDDISHIHGDMCFSNIILTDDWKESRDNIAEHLYFIDPRGILGNEVTSLGDYKYDIAKLAHSVIGLYDFIKSDKIISDKISNNLTFSTSIVNLEVDIESIQEIFTDVFDINEQIYNIMVQLFLSMIPLHSDNKKHQIAMLANALRLYEERTKMI